ncbi:hypothetical protein [Pseudoalteromonas sp. SG43-5]|uniref:hypothetical protein n=1 Tax=Pseudoalteromonas sp. SG43-5 TaxID=2760968 RepID=UPI001600C7FC|nr:hypothetical protein [Pseudoalteromonas sp. SG43-5]MBB1456893.1 hypothetical protein [Pseudoalteromonas sp. SG43-5]
MELYKQEFGQNFDLGFDLKNHPYLIDKSWHNDLCPSFYFKVGEQYYVLWVDYADIEQREEETLRYLITKGVNEGTNDTPEIYSETNSEEVCCCENYKDLKLFLLNFN